MADEIPYQQAPQLRQLLNERENAVAYEQTSRLEAINKQLEGLGYSGHKQAAKAVEAAGARATAAAEEQQTEDAKAEPPKGRTTRTRHTTQG